MINSVLKAIDILQVFSTNEPCLTLTGISDRLGMPKGTTHNLLSTLLSRGFVEETDDGRYALGTAIIGLTQVVRISVELRDRAAPLLRELADAFAAGDIERARSLQRTVNRIRAVFRDGITPAYFKAGLALRGVPAGYVRPPMRELTPKELERLRRESRALGLE